MTTPADFITKLRKEIGGADPGTIYGDVLALCAAYEELAGQCDEWRAAAMEHGAAIARLREMTDGNDAAEFFGSQIRDVLEGDSE